MMLDVKDMPPAVTVAADHALSALERDPQALLEVDGGPVGATADIVVGMLIGFDGQREGWVRLERALPDVYAPLAPTLRQMLADPERYPVSSPSVRTARYALRSGWSRIALSAEDVPGVAPNRRGQVELLVLRYRRRMDS